MPSGRSITVGILVVCFAAIFDASIQNADRRHELAVAIVTRPDIAAERETSSEVLADASSRRLFKRLRADPDWNAEHILWRQYYAEFFKGYHALLWAYLGDVIKLQEERLAATMGDEGLSEGITVRTDPKVVILFSRLRAKGMDTANALRIPDIANHPDLYTTTDQEDSKRMLKNLTSDTSIIALRVELDSIKQRMQTPAFKSYTRAVSETVYARIECFSSDAEARPRLVAFLKYWLERLNVAGAVRK